MANLECARVLRKRHEGLLISTLMHGSEAMIWKERGRKRE